MKDVTLAQGTKVMNLILQRRMPCEQLQELIDSGLLSDLFDANLENGVNREEFRRVLGLKNNAHFWTEFYKEMLNLNVELPVTEERSGYWAIVIAKGLTLNQAYAACERNFKCYKYADNLDKSVTQNDRTSDQSYVVYVKATVEADEDLKNMSANDLKAKGIKGITLLERIVLELFYFWKTEKHLDINNWTLCSGSRSSDGGVPCADWVGDDAGFYVNYYGPDGSDGRLRARQAVS